MSQSKEVDEGNSPEFKWGKKLGANTNIGEIQYFESFMYNGVEYFLYDCVYLYAEEDDPVPYIGKIVKIWDHPKVKKRVNIVWFFLPEEISNWLGDDVPRENEIFLACGEGVGLSNDNRLEAIAAKCNVVCTSKDKRNPQPSKEELLVADHIFYRTFDVGKFTISDKLVDKIDEIDVRYFLNKGQPQKVRPDPIGPELKRTTVRGFDQRGKTPIIQDEDKAKLNSLKTLQHLGSLKKSTLGESAKHTPKEVHRDSSSFRAEKESRQVEDKAKLESLKRLQHLGATKDRLKPDPNVSFPLKVVKDRNANPIQKLRVSSGEDARKSSGLHVRISEHKLKSGPVKDYIEQGREIYNSMSNLTKKAPMLYNKAAPVVGQGNGTESDLRVLKAAQPDKDLIGLDRGISTKPNLSKLSKLSDEGVSKPAQRKEIITDFQVHEVSERPLDRSRWFNFRASWEEKIADAHNKGTLVLFQNLDPSYTSKEIEDLVWSALGEKCNVGVLQQSTYSSPHNGKAFVVFDTAKSADAVLTKLHNGCLMLPNGRPLVAEVGIPRKPGKQTKFVGHLSIDQLDNQKQREEKKNAVSTAHFPQPNTIEYEMSMEWLVLHKRSEKQLEALFEEHGEQLAALKAQLKNTEVG